MHENRDFIKKLKNIKDQSQNNIFICTYLSVCKLLILNGG